MSNKDKRHGFVVGTFVVSSLTAYPSASFPDEGYSLKEIKTMEACYWLSREIPSEGLCGEKMRPDLDTLIREAEKGNSIAAMRLGQLYSSGSWDTEENPAKALKWYTRAAELGDRYSQRRVGYAYEFGRMGVQADTRMAIKYYKMATENGIYPDLEKRIKKLEETLKNE